MKQIKQEKLRDTTLSKLALIIQTGRPDDRSSVPDEIKPYFNHRNELTIVKGII